jgi:hypothetical protein
VSPPRDGYPRATILEPLALGQIDLDREPLQDG